MPGALDLERPRRVLFYRELGFGLGQIAQILAAGADGAAEHLRRQHRLLRQRLARTRALLHTIEREIEAREMGISLTPEEQFEIFGTDKLDQRTQEAAERWGNSAAFRESQRRTATYTKEDWIAIRREADETMRAFAQAMQAGEPADGAVAADLADAHRRHISRWFYDCDPRQHEALAELYLSDARFTEAWETVAPGLSRYVHDAIHANAARAA